jgi:hypothetical protein
MDVPDLNVTIDTVDRIDRQVNLISGLCDKQICHQAADAGAVDYTQPQQHRFSPVATLVVQLQSVETLRLFSMISDPQYNGSFDDV